MNNAVFLDRDGTINVEKNYLYKIEDFEFITGAMDGMKLLQDAGFKLIIITNQSGIARGYYTEEDLEILNRWMISELNNHKIIVEAVYYCPHLPEAIHPRYRKVCNCRKPALGLYDQAIKELNLCIEQSWSIGDKIRDCLICNQTECRGFLIGDNEAGEIINRVRQGKYKNIGYASDLYDAARKIVEKTI